MGPAGIDSIVSIESTPTERSHWWDTISKGITDPPLIDRARNPHPEQGRLTTLSGLYVQSNLA